MTANFVHNFVETGHEIFGIEQFVFVENPLHQVGRESKILARLICKESTVHVPVTYPDICQFGCFNANQKEECFTRQIIHSVLLGQFIAKISLDKIELKIEYILTKSLPEML